MEIPPMGPPENGLRVEYAQKAADFEFRYGDLVAR